MAASNESSQPSLVFRVSGSQGGGNSCQNCWAEDADGAFSISALLGAWQLHLSFSPTNVEDYDK